MTAAPFPKKVFSHLQRLPALENGIVVAVSGGPDSVALLRAVFSLRWRAKLARIAIAHLNHQLRGSESDEDEFFVSALARSASEESELFLADPSGCCCTRVTFHCTREDVATQAKADRANIEETARRIRYDWLSGIAQQEGIRYVATGHTADDQAETVLHRLIRGVGMKGLRSIVPQRALTGNVELIRPLLEVTRTEVLAYLRELGQSYREDTSNRDLRRTRNRIRHELLPKLAQCNPAIVPALCGIAEQAGQLYRRLEALAGELLVRAELPRAGRRLVFDQRCLAAEPRPLIREAIRLAWAREDWPQQAMDFDDWDRLAAVALGELTAVDLPGGIRARLRQRVVLIGPDS